MMHFCAIDGIRPRVVENSRILLTVETTKSDISSPRHGTRNSIAGPSSRGACDDRVPGVKPRDRRWTYIVGLGDDVLRFANFDSLACAVLLRKAQFAGASELGPVPASSLASGAGAL